MRLDERISELVEQGYSPDTTDCILQIETRETTDYDEERAPKRLIQIFTDDAENYEGMEYEIREAPGEYEVVSPDHPLYQLLVDKLGPDKADQVTGMQESQRIIEVVTRIIAVCEDDGHYTEKDIFVYPKKEYFEEV